MRFELRTGLRGAGKTIGVVEELIECAKNPDPSRPRYALNFTDLRPDLAEVITFDQLKNWKSFPPGSTIYVDEAQRFVPVRTSGEPPAWIRDFSESRHLAIDFVWITQKPNMIDKHVRGLIDRHIHTVRKWGTNMVERYEWAECKDDPTCKSAVRSVDEKTRHFYSKEAMDSYTSAVMHTVEKRVPGVVKKAIVIALLIPCALFGGYWYVKRASHAGTAQAAEVQPAKDAGNSSGSLLGSKSEKADSKDKVLTPDEWVKRQVPRVAGIPWSAPMYDDQKPQGTPDLYCAKFEDDHGASKCRCLTEQGTHAEVPHAMCMAFAEGGVYNPFRAPLNKDRDRAPPPQGEPVSPKELTVPAAGSAVSASESTPGRERQTAKAYTPPTYGNWNPDPWGGGSGSR